MKRVVALLIIFSFGFNTAVVAADFSDAGNSGSNPVVDSSNTSQKKVHKIDFGDEKVQTYLVSFRKYLNSDSPDISTLYNIVKENPGKELYKTPLKDGDYAVLYEIAPEYSYYKYHNYVVEYHADGSIMGIVIVSVIDKSHHNNIIVSFEEYRLADFGNFDKKYTMFVDMNYHVKRVDYTQLIYDKDGNIICYEVNDTDLYLADFSNNLIVDIDENAVFGTPQDTSQNLSDSDSDNDYSENIADGQDTQSESSGGYSTPETICLLVGVGGMAVAAAAGTVLAAGVITAASPVLLPVALILSKRAKKDKDKGN
ncbi:hypothetical protein IKP85_04825 [bacterium]|nr:hypothetical protein [bacterium]